MKRDQETFWPTVDSLKYMKKYNLILASGSPRRKELIGWIGVPFVVVKSDVEEISSHTDPLDVVADLARQKGEDVLQKVKILDPKRPLPMVVSSDTMVCLNDKIYGKPKDRDEARVMLQELSGKVHQVYTSVCIHYYSQNEEIKTFEFVEKSDVEFQKILPDVLEIYLQSDDSLDKAGSYGIQGQALTFIKGLNGSYTNVMGFPLSEFVFKLKEICEAEGFENWRDAFV